MLVREISIRTRDDLVTYLRKDLQKRNLLELSLRDYSQLNANLYNYHWSNLHTFRNKGETITDRLRARITDNETPYIDEVYKSKPGALALINAVKDQQCLAWPRSPEETVGYEAYMIAPCCHQQLLFLTPDIETMLGIVDEVFDRTFGPYQDMYKALRWLLTESCYTNRTTLAGRRLVTQLSYPKFE